MNHSAPRHGGVLAGCALALAATAIWSGNFIVARGLSRAVEPATLAFCRWATALIVLLPLAGAAAWRERRVMARHLRFLVLTSFLGVTVFNTIVYLAGRSTQALNLALIATTSPAFIILFARIRLGEPITARKLAGLAACLAGAVLLITRGDLSRLAGLGMAAGDAWMLLAAAIFAAYSILVRLRPAELGQSAFLLSTFGLGLAMLTPWAAWEVWSHGLPEPTPALAGSVLYVGLGASLASYWCWNRAVALAGPARAGMVYYSLPVFSGLEAWLILDEPVGWVHAASAALIIGGIVAATRQPGRRGKK